MKTKKILLTIIIGLLFILPISVKAEGKVKVYIFEAGGCPYCEAQKEYLQGLESYNQKFEIISKELYVDHVDWEKGKDYTLGKTVAEAFLAKGFTDASYEGTPFVVISDIYAAAAYNQNLESVIDTAYEQGDKDVVGCVENGGENCLEGVDIPTDTSEDEEKTSDDTLTVIILAVVVVGLGVLIFLTRKANKEEEMLDRAFSVEDEEETPKKVRTEKEIKATKEIPSTINKVVRKEVTKAVNVTKTSNKKTTQKLKSSKSNNTTKKVSTGAKKTTAKKKK